MNNKRRIVITGAGVTSCFGMDVEVFFKKLLAGESGVGPMNAFPCEDYPTRFAAEVRNFDPEGYLDKKQARRVDPAIAYAIVAGKKALEHAGIDDDTPLDKKRCGAIIGSGMGGMQTFANGVGTVLNKGFKRLTPFFVPYIITNMPCGLFAIEVGFQGPNYSISTACATGAHCIVSAAHHLERGEADLIVCGGTEAAINPVGVSGFVACKALSTRNDDPQGASRPWDKTRDGFVMGDGCGVIVLETLEHAQKRGATILAEYLGGFVNCDAHHMTDPIADGSGVAYCIEEAIKNAGVPKDRINYVNAHATSTFVGDMCEVRALRSVFGKDAEKLKISATKSIIGHCLGAAGGMEAIATAMGIHQGKIHPTINSKDLEDELEGMDIVPGKAQDYEIDIALSNSFGFGGHNAILVLGRYRD